MVNVTGYKNNESVNVDIHVTSLCHRLMFVT